MNEGIEGEMRGEYNTKQKRELLNFLQRHDKENFSVDDVVFRLRELGEPVGRSTVYRYLESLAEQGSVRKYQNARGITQYQHIANDASCSEHFHMLCRSCGVLFHVDCDQMASLERHLMERHGFYLDPRETVLAGMCAGCAGREPKEADCDGADHHEGCHHCL